MNKKIIVLVVSSLMIMTGIVMLVNNSTNSTNTNNGKNVSTEIASSNVNSPYWTGFSNVTTTVDYQNFTLPDYNYAQFDSVVDRSDTLFGNSPIYTRDNVFHQSGFVYLNTSNDLVFYSTSTHTVKLLNNSWTQLSQSGRIFYGLRSWLQYYQLPNGSLYDVWTFGQLNGAGSPYVAIYYFYNSTFFLTYQVNNNWASGEYFAKYQITNDSFWFSDTVNVAGGLATDYITFINFTKTYTTNTVNYEYSGLAVDDSLYNSAFNQVSGNNNGSMSITIWNGTTSSKVIFNILNTTTETVKWINTTFNIDSQSTGQNNIPFTFAKLSNGTILYYAYVQIKNTVPQNYALYKIYFNPKTENVIGNSYISYNDTDSCANELLTNEPYISYSGFYNGIQRNTTFAGQEFFNYFNSTRWITTNSYLNSLMVEDMQISQASVNDYASYLYSGSYSDTGTDTQVTVFWLPQYTTLNYAYNTTTVNKHTLEIKENGLPSGTQWSYTFNGTSYTLTNSSYDYSLLNGSYALSVNSVSGYTVTYPSTITIDNANQIAYINFTAIPKYKVTMNENGLPSGTSFTYDFNSVSYTLTNNSYVYELSNGTYPLSVTSVAGYLTHYSSTITVAGITNFYINFSKIATYTLVVKETGLSGILWHIFVNGKEYNSSTAYNNVTGLTNDTYTFSVDNVAGYTLSTYPTSITIDGSNYTVNLTFTKNAHLYQVTFIEKGLFANTNWEIVFNGSNYLSDDSNTIIVPSLVNGTYSFSVDSVSGFRTDTYVNSVTISGSNLTEHIYFNETYTFTINISNYTSSLTMTFNGSAITFTNTYTIDGLVNYSYSFSLTLPNAYKSSSLPNTITINGNNYVLNVTISKINIKVGTYEIIFNVVGLPKGTQWSLIVGNNQYFSNTSTLILYLSNGTYTPIVSSSQTYTLSEASPYLVVTGQSENYTIFANTNNLAFLTNNMPYLIVLLLFIGMFIVALAIKRSAL